MERTMNDEVDLILNWKWVLGQSIPKFYEDRKVIVLAPSLHYSQNLQALFMDAPPKHHSHYRQVQG